MGFASGTHGTAPWTAALERRALLYRYIPGYLATGRDASSEFARLKAAAQQAAPSQELSAADALHLAMLEPAWHSSKQPGYGEASLRGGVLDTIVARPDLACLLEAATTAAKARL